MSCDKTWPKPACQPLVSTQVEDNAERAARPHIRRHSPSPALRKESPSRESQRSQRNYANAACWGQATPNDGTVHAATVGD